MVYHQNIFPFYFGSSGKYLESVKQSQTNWLRIYLCIGYSVHCPLVSSSFYTCTTIKGCICRRGGLYCSIRRWQTSWCCGNSSIHLIELMFGSWYSRLRFSSVLSSSIMIQDEHSLLIIHVIHVNAMGINGSASSISRCGEGTQHKLYRLYIYQKAWA